MSGAFKGLVIVIPTRNRARFAMNAVRSVISQPDCTVEVLLSDNSTEPKETDRLVKFCEQHAGDRVSYIKPPRPLSMTEHYDWAFKQALERYEANHFALLTDRMVFKQGYLAEVLRLASLFPDEVVTYMHDRVNDYSSPVYLDQLRWTGDVFRLRSERLLQLSSQLVTHDSLPRLMNCVVPRTVFNALRCRHGNIFDSIAPDYNFCYRCLDICESIVYYDKAVLIHYALYRSNGESQSRGLPSKDHLDFIANLGERRFNFAAPIPEILTVNNAIAHEYCYAKSETNSGKFPDVDMGHYVSALAREVGQLQNQQLREEMQAILAQHGWSPEPEAEAAMVRLSLARKLMSPRIVLWKLKQITRPVTDQLWSLARLCGIRPPGNPIVGFKSTGDALHYAETKPRPREQTTEHINFLCPVPLDLRGNGPISSDRAGDADASA